MTKEELEALAARIADLLARQGWVPGPDRPERRSPPTHGTPPAWSGAAQQLSDIAPTPGRKTNSGRHRPAYDAIVAASRAAAAGRGPAPLPGGNGAVVSAATAGRTVKVGISNRHMHITPADFEKLFGAGKQPTPERPISQPGQFAAVERVRVVGPKGAIEGIRIVGPTRKTTQVELSTADCRAMGLDAPVRHSGATAGSAAVRLEGPVGSVALREGTIIAARHIHVSSADAGRLGVADGDRVSVMLGPTERRVTLHDVLIRSGGTHATEMHLDTDEAHAFGVKTGDLATLTGRAQGPRTRAGRGGPRPLLTERDVDRVAATGETLSDRSPYRLTPLARDRAKALGIWREEK